MEKDEDLLSRSLAKPIVVKCRYDEVVMPRSQYDGTAAELTVPKRRNKRTVNGIALFTCTFAAMLRACAIALPRFARTSCSPCAEFVII